MGERKVSYRLFTTARRNAKNRGIEWALTYEEWWRYWHASGKWGLRGKTRGTYQMDRIHNGLGYVPGNIQIILGSVNRVKDSPHGWNPKLTETAVFDIRNNFAKGVRGWRYFAAKYGVSEAAIKAVRTGRNWSA